MFWLSIAFAAAHLIWCAANGQHSIDLQSILLNVIPYGVPVLIFAVALHEFSKESPRWSLPDTVLGALFTLSYCAMVLHVTIAGSIGDFINVYFNVPIVYAVPIVLIGLVWWIARLKPKAETAVIGKVLYALPLVAIAAMVVHCGVLFIVEFVRHSGTEGIPSTSFPWWGMPLIFGIMYLIVAGLCFGAYAIYCILQKRKEKTESVI